MRVIIVTAANSGIGHLVSAALRIRGDRVISVDTSDADVVADLSFPKGRQEAADRIMELAHGCIDGIAFYAGYSPGFGSPDAPGECVSVNFFGVTRLVSLLNPVLQESRAGRVVLITSQSLLHEKDPAVIAACLADDEGAAVAAASVAPDLCYQSSKMAISLWVKREAVKQEWAGAGILLNAIAPGVVMAPGIKEMLATS